MKNLIGDQKLLRIYIKEELRTGHNSTWQTLLERAHADGLAGCTVLRGFAGFGTHHGFHSELSFDGAGDWAMILEFIDSEANIESFLKSSSDLLSNTTLYLKPVRVRKYDSKNGGEIK